MDASEQEQARAVFTHAGEEIRFFKSQQWHVTNYVVLSYAALSAIPSWITHPEAAELATYLCLPLAPLAGWWAWRILDSLDTALEKERHRMDGARAKLPLVKEIHAETVKEIHAGVEPRERSVKSILQEVIIGGAIFAIYINFSRLLS